MSKMIFRYDLYDEYSFEKMDEFADNPSAIVICSNCCTMAINISKENRNIIENHKDGLEFEMNYEKYREKIDEFRMLIDCGFIRDKWYMDEGKYTFQITESAIPFINNPSIFWGKIGKNCPCCGKEYTSEDSIHIVGQFASIEYLTEHTRLLVALNDGKFFAHNREKISEKYNYILENCKSELPKIDENDKEALFDAGMAYALSQIIDLLANDVDGIHLYTMNNPVVARRICEGIRNLV